MYIHLAGVQSPKWGNFRPEPGIFGTQALPFFDEIFNTSVSILCRTDGCGIMIGS
jgi:hypothetical protein